MTNVEIIEAIKITAAIVAGGFAYFKFFREGTHHQRIQFDLDCVDIGELTGQRVIEIGCVAENKGNVEQRFDDIRVSIRGIDGAPLKELEGHEPRLEFPLKLADASLVADKLKYYFVRPKVKQRFPLVIKIPSSTKIILVRATFRYENTKEIHSAERSFRLPAVGSHSQAME